MANRTPEQLAASKRLDRSIRRLIANTDRRVGELLRLRENRYEMYAKMHCPTCGLCVLEEPNDECSCRYVHQSEMSHFP